MATSYFIVKIVNEDPDTDVLYAVEGPRPLRKLRKDLTRQIEGMTSLTVDECYTIEKMVLVKIS